MENGAISIVAKSGNVYKVLTALILWCTIIGMNNNNWYWNLTFFFTFIVVEIYDVGKTTVVEDPWSFPPSTYCITKK